MEIDFWKPTVSAGVVKATIHQSGKLGFSQAAIKKLNLGQNVFVMIGINRLQSEDNAIYLKIAKESEEMTLKVSKAGKYYYLNTKDFFNENSIDYRRKKIIFDIIDISEGHDKLFRLIPREKDRKRRLK